jgi:uncharacterized protein
LNKTQTFIFSTWLIFNAECGNTQPKQIKRTMTAYPYTNELINENSPYLLEHAHNPVNWYPWGEKALSKAKKENKPLIISIGYAACHWCHVMERESYEDSAVATIMNKYFVSIKVDREERPDIDQIYMDVAILINGSGGWPLNAFALPNGKPFYAGTYFQKGQWISILENIRNAYDKNYKELETEANHVTDGIETHEHLLKDSITANDLTIRRYHDILDQFLPIVDFKNGGFKSSQKFPLPVGWEFLLQYHYLTHNEDALQAVGITLDKMAMGGIYDQLGGGFARYSTDSLWKVPHFEKMLYDNAQLVSLYAHAFQVTKNPLYAEIISETLNFINREMTNTEGGFYSSLNADSEGEEGRYYIWSATEMDEILGKENSQFISAYLQVTRNGNWEANKNILHRIGSPVEFAINHHLQPDSFKKLLDRSKRKLQDVRDKRIRPSTDDKILTSWNSLMINGYLDAYQALDNPEYLSVALKNARFIEKNMLKENGQLMRNYTPDKHNIPGFLDDYALFIQSLIKLYQVTFHIHWLNLAKNLTDYTIKYFKDKESAMFYYTSEQSVPLITRKIEISDNVIPSSNSVMAKNLFVLGEYFDDAYYTDLSLSMLRKVMSEAQQGGVYYANWLSLLGMIEGEPIEIAMMGKDAQEMNHQLQKQYLPTSLFMGGNEENLPLLAMKSVNGANKIYVCRNKTCQFPVDNVDHAILLIQNK